MRKLLTIAAALLLSLSLLNGTARAYAEDASPAVDMEIEGSVPNIGTAPVAHPFDVEED